jgi:hypothetical protein
MIETPLVFSQWVPWKERHLLKTADSYPPLGVYLWSYFSQAPKPTVLPYPDLPTALIYAGETKNLNVRPLGSHRHHRLLHYVDGFPEDPGYTCLYVSVFHVDRFEPSDKWCLSLRAFTRYVEDRIYWEYTRRFGQRPALDYKNGKEKP